MKDTYIPIHEREKSLDAKFVDAMVENRDLKKKIEIMERQMERALDKVEHTNKIRGEIRTELEAEYAEKMVNDRVRWVVPTDRIRDYFAKASTGTTPIILPDEKTLEEVYRLAGLQMMEKTMAAHFGVSERTWQNTKGRFPEIQAAVDLGREHGKTRLLEVQFGHVADSVPMAIHLGKQYLGQSEKTQTEVTGFANLFEAMKGLPMSMDIIDVEIEEATFTQIGKNDE